jgi:hypothetical protein
MALLNSKEEELARLEQRVQQLRVRAAQWWLEHELALLSVRAARGEMVRLAERIKELKGDADLGNGTAEGKG